MADDRSVVFERNAMLAGMTPVLREGRFVFCITTDGAAFAAASPLSLATFREDEGMTLILAEADAARLGFSTAMPMARIVLQVFSALDGVGLTAAVATALANEGIPCNVVSAFHHDHVFVPRDAADRALRVLKDVQAEAAKAAA